MLALVGIALCVVGSYFSLDLVRVTKGAPSSWYAVVAAFVTLAVYEVVRLYYDTRTPSNFPDDLRALILILFGVLLVTGLATLNFRFRRLMQVQAEGSSP